MDGFAISYGGQQILLTTGIRKGIGREGTFRFLEEKNISFKEQNGISIETIQQKDEWKNIQQVAGSDALFGWDIIMDASAKKITLARDLDIFDQQEKIPVDSSKGLPIVHAKLNNKEVPLLLDTASTHSFLSEEWFAKKASLPETSGYLFGEGECSGPQMSATLIIGSQSFQQQFIKVLENLHKEWQSLGVQGILGINFFRNKKIGLSLLHEKLFIAKE